jgi:biotin transporter BioY
VDGGLAGLRGDRQGSVGPVGGCLAGWRCGSWCAGRPMGDWRPSQPIVQCAVPWCGSGLAGGWRCWGCGLPVLSLYCGMEKTSMG